MARNGAARLPQVFSTHLLKDSELLAVSGRFRLDNSARSVDRLSEGGDNLGTYVPFSLQGASSWVTLDEARPDGLTLHT